MHAYFNSLSVGTYTFEVNYNNKIYIKITKVDSDDEVVSDDKLIDTEVPDDRKEGVKLNLIIVIKIKKLHKYKCL